MKLAEYTPSIEYGPPVQVGGGSGSLWWLAVPMTVLALGLGVGLFVYAKASA